jgi:hypothetical protein
MVFLQIKKPPLQVAQFQNLISKLDFKNFCEETWTAAALGCAVLSFVEVVRSNRCRQLKHKSQELMAKSQRLFLCVFFGFQNWLRLEKTARS